MNLNCSSWRVNWLKQAWTLIVLYCFKIQNSDWGWPNWSPKKTKPSQSTCSSIPMLRLRPNLNNDDLGATFGDTLTKTRNENTRSDSRQPARNEIFRSGAILRWQKSTDFVPKIGSQIKKIVSVWPDVNKLPLEKKSRYEFLKRHREK